jgi:hypothetical protein
VPLHDAGSTGAPVPMKVSLDDMVDSRWTFTIVAAVLREAGSGPVFPLALARVEIDADG